MKNWKAKYALRAEDFKREPLPNYMLNSPHALLGHLSGTIKSWRLNVMTSKRALIETEDALNQFFKTNKM